jgi:hypothetical protein
VDNGVLLGKACPADPSQCVSGVCSDGVCCSSVCDGGCDACTKAVGAGEDGVCGILPAGSPGTPSCSPYTCDGKAGTCPGGCASDADCGADRYCGSDAACKARKAQGAACNASGKTAGGDCLVDACRLCSPQGGCVDGVCCDKACAGACDVCAKGLGAAADGVCSPAPLASAGSPSCEPFTCNGVKPDCPAECLADHHCVKGRYCAADGICVPQKPQGAVCNQAAGADCRLAGCRVCATGHCADGLCCNQPCSRSCDVCAQALGAVADGACTPAPAGFPGKPSCAPAVCDGAGTTCPGGCLDDSTCGAGHYCAPNGACVPKKGKGVPCASSGECAAPAAWCADGVCCTSECTDLCFACSAALKQSHAEGGECGPAAAGLDPHGHCPKEAKTTCGYTGVCGGAGACQTFPAGAACGPTNCASGITKGKVCDGLGTCETSAAGVACAPYVCLAGACSSPCAQGSDCATGYFCIGGVCSKKLAAGTACSEPEACESGHCVDGVCCESECTGQCEACGVGGAEGKCVAVSGAPRGTRPPCNGAAGSPCAGACDGKSATKCAYSTGAVCKTECVGAGASSVTSQCDGTGWCAPQPAHSCGLYACDSTPGACKTTCSSQADCATGAECNVGAKQCVASGKTCKDDFTVRVPGGTLVDCRPYRCSAGVCRDSCSAAADCAPGFHCVGAGCAVVMDSGAGGAAGAGGGPGAAGASGSADAAPSAGSTGQPPASAPAAQPPPAASGCGCRAPGPRSRAGAVAIGVAVGALWLVRRRRRARPARRQRDGA